MFYILENEEQLQRLELMGGSGCYLEIVTTNDNFHPKLSGMVAVYIRPLEDSKGYIIPIDHNEGMCVPVSRVEKVLDSFSKIYILDKKAGLYFFNLGRNVCDLSLKYSMVFFKRLDVKVRNTTYNWFYNRYGGSETLNKIIPISKIYEKCEETFKQVRKVLELDEPEGFDFYNEKATKLYWMVEQSGIRVDVHNFVERFKPQNPDFSIKGETVYSSYNLYNATSRPTNSFNSVNFVAIPKALEFRRVFKPQNDKFVEMDFDGYHIRLVSKQVGYGVDVNQKAHKFLAAQYLGPRELTTEEYAKVKALNFQMIYGTPSEEYSGLEISNRVQDLIKQLWKQYKEKNYIVNPDSGKQFTSKLADMYPQKLFNYYIQSLETSRNVSVLYNVQRFLNKGHYKTRIILITYDSFLVDWDESEGQEVLDGIRKYMEYDSKNAIRFPVGIKVSENLCF